MKLTRWLVASVILIFLFAGITVSAQQRRSASMIETSGRGAILDGNALYASGEYERAIERYRIVPKTSSSYAQAIYNIGVCEYELWHTEQAVKFYESAIDAKGGNYPKASYALGVALEDLHRTKEAKAAYEQTIEAAQERFAPPFYRLGLLAANESDVALAERLFRQAILMSDSDFPEAHNNLGVILTRLNRYGEAQSEFNIAVTQSHGNYSDARRNLALCNDILARKKNDLLATKTTLAPVIK